MHRIAAAAIILLATLAAAYAAPAPKYKTWMTVETGNGDVMRIIWYKYSAKKHQFVKVTGQ